MLNQPVMRQPARDRSCCHGQRLPRLASASVRAFGLGAWIALTLALLLSGCAGPRLPPLPAPPSSPAPAPPLRPLPGPITSTPSPTPDRDGPGANPPPDLLQLPDAEPRIEPPRVGGPNKPYEALGQAYTPLLGDPVWTERGLASWYGRKFHGRRTANGETYDMYAMTAAHKTLPLPSYVRVLNPANGREVVVRVNDRGPFHGDRIIDLSYTAAAKLGLLRGVAPVQIERLTLEAIRSGSWRRPGGETVVAQSASRAAVPALEPEAETAADPIAEIARRASGPGPAALTSTPTTTPTTTPATTPATTLPAGFWLQLGAFRDAVAAHGWREQLQQRADWLQPWLTVLGDAQWHRVQAGPYATRPEAALVAQRLRDLLRLTPVLLERR